MASSPQFKVYDQDGTYQAACKDICAAAVLVAFYGDGATVRSGHTKIIWTEGVDGSAAENYDSIDYHFAEKD